MINYALTSIRYNSISIGVAHLHYLANLHHNLLINLLRDRCQHYDMRKTDDLKLRDTFAISGKTSAADHFVLFQSS